MDLGPFELVLFDLKNLHNFEKDLINQKMWVFFVLEPATLHGDCKPGLRGCMDCTTGLRYTENKSIIMADFNKESKSMMFFCYHETSPLDVQLFLKTLVMDISDGQNFAALYFFCKVYIFPLFALKP